MAQATLTHRGQSLTLDTVLIDTGSAGTIFQVDLVSAIGLTYSRSDVVREIVGVGGSEFVVTTRLDRLVLGEIVVDDVEIQLGGMEYGFRLDGIIGMNVLGRIGAAIDLAVLELRAGSAAR